MKHFDDQKCVNELQSVSIGNLCTFLLQIQIPCGKCGKKCSWKFLINMHQFKTKRLDKKKLPWITSKIKN